MPDVYATIADQDEAVQQQIADVLELRAADRQQRAMLDDYLRDLELAPDARVLEIGCGTGAVCRVLATRPRVAQVIGVDPSIVLVQRARELAEGHGGLSFVVGDGRELPFDAASFDAVVCHTSLCHIPEPERVLAEAARVTVAGGLLAVFDGDYVTTTVAIGEPDPLQACADAAVEALVYDRFLVRRLPSLFDEVGWSLVRVRSHGYVESSDPSYMLTIVDRGADALVTARRIGEEAAAALKDEARRRVAEGRFFGHIAYVSAIGMRPTPEVVEQPR
jgi:ubiquinone/menaquinone biosynthesis C-methylase UbiE